MTQRERDDLDRYITGNYGEDSVPDDEPVTLSPEFGRAVAETTDDVKAAMDWIIWIKGTTASYAPHLVALESRIRTLEAQVEAQKVELDLWRPLTDAEAEEALANAKGEPLSDERIAEIVKFATDPARRIDNSEQAQLAARNTALESALQQSAERERRLRDLLSQAVADIAKHVPASLHCLTGQKSYLEALQEKGG